MFSLRALQLCKRIGKPLNISFVQRFQCSDKHSAKKKLALYNESLKENEAPNVEKEDSILDKIRSTVVEKELSDEILKESLASEDYFGVRKLINMKEMFDSRVYMGHKIGTLNEHMKPYIYGERLGHLVIDLRQTEKLLFEALNFAAHIAFRDGVILFVNKSPTTGHLVEQLAERCGEYSHCREWFIGTFTDSTRFYGSVTRLPDLLIFLNTMNNVFERHPAVPEAAKLLIPTIGIVDTNSDPLLITYPVPGNDDTFESINYYCNVFEKAIKLGKEKRKALHK